MSDFLNPQKIIKKLFLKDGMIIADFGCGSGGWVIPLAKRVKNGRIYAVDVLEEALSALRSKAEFERVYNAYTLRADVERGTDIPANHLDLVILSNILFQAEDKIAIISEAHRILKEGGRIIVVDWKISPNDEEKIIDKKIKQSGFVKVREIDAGKSHFATLYEKK